ncbi:hypothetical protein IAQ67_15935 [Paenibacillus peoriae]|uniref:Uncharacterized protein n=1 Tax=Paenibacillus peoriae TaxID=59893 RepID=A0A7H0Y2S5_9BACL|nr:hypothetical protein [Paenibacillus peoriae]QNR65383.1 hypothetical protein IAQ67_15935 [Paenibacillus peoriae]
MNKDKKIYIYNNPLERGYKQFKLSKKQHNHLFPKRKKKWNTRYEYYYNDKRIIVQHFTSYLAIALTTIMFPVLILFAGLSNFKEAITEMKHLYFEKKYGKFYEDWINSEIHQKDNKIINKKFTEIMVIINGGD